MTKILTYCRSRGGCSRHVWPHLNKNVTYGISSWLGGLNNNMSVFHICAYMSNTHILELYKIVTFGIYSSSHQCTYITFWYGDHVAASNLFGMALASEIPRAKTNSRDTESVGSFLGQQGVFAMDLMGIWQVAWDDSDPFFWRVSDMELYESRAQVNVIICFVTLVINFQEKF